MWIIQFSTFIEEENLTDYVLQNETVVVDAQNFFYGLYQKSGLQYAFGCESDKYADFLRSYLSMFKKANVQCYFIFKGGHQEYMKKRKIFDDYEKYSTFNINENHKDIVLPIFMKDVYKQILDEMGFDYTICEYEAKRECIALAQKLNCPVVGNDIEFCFSGLPYIMSTTLEFDERANSIKCKIFSLDVFLKKYGLTEEKLSYFITLTDEKQFPKNHFLVFIKSLRIPLGYYKRNLEILKWLSQNTKEQALAHLSRYVDVVKDDFLAIQRKNLEFIRRVESLGIPAQYLENGAKIVTTKKDPLWFQKGVASKHIPLQLINLARFGVFEGSWAIADYTQDDPRMITLDIVKYTYNLLTNFEKDELTLYMKNTTYRVSLKDSISKPSYNGINNPFENGWEDLKGELFKHFLNELLGQGFDFESIQILPENLRMIMVALIYFSKKKPTHTRNEVCSILLSYVALQESHAEANNNVKSDRQVAKTVLKAYFQVTKEEAKRIFDIKMLHPLVEFQHCLQSLNYLNVLCGKLYKPTIYSNTFNATLVYKVLHTIENSYDGDCKQFLNEELNSAPTVRSDILNLMEIYDKIMENM